MGESFALPEEHKNIALRLQEAAQKVKTEKKVELLTKLHAILNGSELSEDMRCHWIIYCISCLSVYDCTKLVVDTKHISDAMWVYLGNHCGFDMRFGEDDKENQVIFQWELKK